jgi:hypothetical protein
MGWGMYLARDKAEMGWGMQLARDNAFLFEAIPYKRHLYVKTP